MERMTIQHLHNYVLSEIWLDNPALWIDIRARYFELIQHTPFANFGTDEFWAAGASQSPKRKAKDLRCLSPKRRRLEIQPKITRSKSSMALLSTSSPSATLPSPKRYTSNPDKLVYECERTVESSSQPVTLVPEITSMALPFLLPQPTRSSSCPQIGGGGAITRSAAKRLVLENTIQLERTVEQPASVQSASVQPSDEKGYVFSELSNVYVKRYKTNGKYLQLKFTKDPDSLATMRSALNEAIVLGFERAPEGVVGVEVQHPNLTKPILIPFSTREKMITDNAFNFIEAVSISNLCFELQIYDISI